MHSDLALKTQSIRRDSEPIKHQRVKAAAAVSFKTVHSKTRLDRLYQQGSAKIRFPKCYNNALEAVLINTAGGLTGGDKLDWSLNLGPCTNVVATTQACEKAYKSVGEAAQLTSTITLGEKSALHWLPQETILYDGSALNRRFDVTLHSSATLLAVEVVQLGREAMGETLETLSFHDRWRIKRNDEMLFADDMKLTGYEAGCATLGHNRALASLLFITPLDEEQGQALVSKLRNLCTACLSGFSYVEGKIVGRLLASDTYQLRQALAPVLKEIRGSDLPRVWRI